MADEQALDDALAQLSAGQDELNTAVQALVDKANAADIDLSDEIAQIQDIQSRQSDATRRATDATTAGSTGTEPTGDTGGTGGTEPTA